MRVANTSLLGWLSGRCHFRVRPSLDSRRRRPLQRARTVGGPLSSAQERGGFLNQTKDSFWKLRNLTEALRRRIGPEQRAASHARGGCMVAQASREARGSRVTLTTLQTTPLHTFEIVAAGAPASSFLTQSALSLSLAESVACLASVPAVCPADDFSTPFFEEGTIALSICPILVQKRSAYTHDFSLLTNENVICPFAHSIGKSRGREHEKRARRAAAGDMQRSLERTGGRKP